MKNEYTSPRGVITFPHVFVPKALNPGDEPRFSVNIHFTPEAQKSAEFKRMKKAVLDVAVEKFGDKAASLIKSGAVKTPFKDAGLKDYDGFNEGDVYISPWTKNKPGVVDGNLEDVVPSDLFSGCTARVTYSAWAYDVNGNRGVSFSLNNMQVTSFEGDRLDGKRAAKSDFDAIDGGVTEDELEDDDVPFLAGPYRG